MIAQRTKDALQAAKARGVVLGNPKLDAVRDRAVASVRADADRFAKNVAPIIREIQSSGVASHRAIARSLNARGVATARGGEWTAVRMMLSPRVALDALAEILLMTLLTAISVLLRTIFEAARGGMDGGASRLLSRCEISAANRSDDCLRWRE